MITVRLLNGGSVEVHQNDRAILILQGEVDAAAKLISKYQHELSLFNPSEPCCQSTLSPSPSSSSSRPSSI